VVRRRARGLAAALPQPGEARKFRPAFDAAESSPSAREAACARDSLRALSVPVRFPRSLHCPQCGSRLEPARVEGRERERCPSCRYVVYDNPAGAAAGVVIDERGRVLLIRRAIEPQRGAWALPAGYQEIDEEPARAAEREVREESGLEVRAEVLLDLFLVSPAARKPANLAVYLCRVVGGALEPGDDALEARWFALDELPDEIAFDNRARILSRLGADERYLRAVAAISTSEGGASERAPAPISYKDAGVDIEKKYSAVERATDAIRRTFTPGVLGDIGLFGGLFDLERAGVGARSVLVASADGVGTKLEIAKRARIYDSVGRDIVNHCVDDILVQGAKPLFFLDYVAVGRMEPDVVSALIRGCAEACRENSCALLGGETAEMPGLYAPGDFDLAGFIVGAVEREKLLDGSRVRAGQVLLGLGSSGLHTNGYSLARKIAFDALGLQLDARPRELGGKSLGEALLAVHRSYLSLLWPLLEQDRIAALAHVTGGGLCDNVPRVLGEHDAWIDRTRWEVPALFRFLCEAGRVDAEEAYHVFNMGIGMVLIVDPREAEAVRAHMRARSEPVFEIGRVERGGGAVRWTR
jgi:phosphoribosylformylglycinamidine cyclo-ligase